MARKFHTYQEWLKLDKDVQEYEIYKALAEVNNGKLRKAAIVVFSAFFGGYFAVISSYTPFFKGLLE